MSTSTEGSSSDLVLGIDAGTAGIRAGLFTLAGLPLAFAEQNYPTLYPRPTWAEQQPIEWWHALVSAIQQCLATANITPERVKGLAIDAPCNIFLVDAVGNPLTASLIWMDLRGVEQAQRLTATRNPALRSCGGEVPAEWPLPKILWLKEQMPALWEKATYVVEQMSWLTWRLTGEWVVPLNSAAAKWHYLNADAGERLLQSGTTEVERDWPISLFQQVGLEDLMQKLPTRILPMGGKAGELSTSAAQALGLPAGIAVAVSGIDAHAGMVGMNVVTPGKLALITGTSSCQLTQAIQPVFDNGLWGPFGDAVVKGVWTLEAGQTSTGGTVRWLLDLCGAHLTGDADRYAMADELAAQVPPGAEGLTVLDYWQGSRTPIKDPTARGTIWGLTPAHGLGHLLRAVYEATAYGNRHILERLRHDGVQTEHILACGGGTRSNLWLHILADVAGVPITLPTVVDAVALGSAMCAAVGAGCFSDLTEAGQTMMRPARTIMPDRALSERYTEGYERYRATYAALAPLFHEPLVQ